MRFACLNTISWVLLLLLAGMPAKAQPPELVARFPFEQLNGGVVVLKARLDHYPDSLNFILDTGSGGISLDSTTVERLKVPTVPTGRTIRGIAGIRTVRFANNHALRFPRLNIDSLNFHINDYDLLTGVYGIKVDGIIGYSVLRRYIVRLDYDKKIVEFYTPGDMRYPRFGKVIRPAIVGLPMQHAIVEEASKVDARFYLDTGAGMCLLLSEAFAADSNLFAPSKSSYPTVAEGLGGKKPMKMLVLKKFSMAGFKFKNMPAYVFDDSYNVTNYPQLGGLIGNDLLRRFNVIINYPKGEIHLSPNTHFREGFDYSYTGLGLYSEEGKIIITDVIPESPADEAGLQVGDELLAIDNLLTSNMQLYRNALQQTGKRIKILLRRNGQLVQTNMYVKNIKP